MYQLLNYSYSATLPTFSPIYFSQFVDVVTKAKIPNFLVVALDERTVTFLKVRPTPTLTPNPHPNPNPNPTPNLNLPTGEEDAALLAEATLGLRLDG